MSHRVHPVPRSHGRLRAAASLAAADGAGALFAVKLSGHVYANRSSTTTFLVVSSSGEVTLQATGVKKCSNNPACTPIVMVWRANVISYVA